MSRQKKFYYFLSALFIATFILALGVEAFAFAQASSLQGSYKEASYRTEKLTEKIDYLDLLSDRYADIEADIPSINNALPDKKESSKLLSDLDSLAVQSGLKLTLMQSTNYGKKQTATGDKSLLQTVKGKYGQEMPLDIKVEGSFNNFLTFIKHLENYQRMIGISSMEITRVDEPGAPADAIEVKLRLTAYLKK